MRVRDNNIRVTLFTREYGKIHAWLHKKQVNFDIGDLTILTIDRAQSINTLKDVYILASSIETTGKYKDLYGLLEILGILYKYLPLDVPYPRVFDDYEKLIQLLKKSKNFELTQSHLFKLRILKHFGILNETPVISPIGRYIVDKICNKEVFELFSSKTLDIHVLKELEISIHTSLNQAY